MREDWIECDLAEVTRIYPGIGFPKDIQGKIEGTYPFYKVGDISKNFLKGRQYLLECDHYVDENDVTKLKAKLVEPNTVVFAKIGEGLKLNRRAITNRLSLIDNNTVGIKAKEPLLHLFIFYFFNTIRLEKLSQATTVPSVRKSDIEKIQFPLPPLPEQRAIVKKLENLLSSLDAGVADLKKAQQQLKIYRQAVLKKAFEGLTETIILNDAGAWNGGGTPSTQNKDFWENGNINWVSSQDVKTKYIEDTERKITSIAIENSSTKWIEKNALLFVVRSGILRRIFPIAIAKVNLCVNQDIQTLTLNKKYLTEFVYWYLMGNEYDIRHNCAKDGTTVESIDVSKLKKYRLPTCTLDKQKEIVKQIESRLSVCDSIEQNIKESLEKAEALRQSILKRAFEGNLLAPQELAECKQAADYEPASVLLEQIKAEQNKATAKRSKKKVAEPLVVAKVETSVAKISADIHAGLIAKVIKIHEENPASIDNLSHIKCEKIAHLVEYHLQIPLGRQPVKDAAGPDDYPHLKSVESRAKKAGFFNILKKPIGYSYSSASNSGKVIDKFQSALSDEKNRQLDNLIDLFLKFDLEVSEIIATTYAGWNNLILNGNANPSDEEIVYESRENWSERKLKIARERFFKAIEWMRKNEIVPTGYGAVVPFPKKKK
ncbi:restriction endonuclease subunit S [Pedobacter agri]|uniref:restriction endonuclease subunit S n=1 Tax=Pedobacter agri TaxID=454586 RepID=UPI002788CBD5|nr:restriction endonuclease subunit S [Pedobacter agri]MDQ1142425.1 type I restriction enzyme S subunit [Pedobacter agri]